MSSIRRLFTKRLLGANRLPGFKNAVHLMSHRGGSLEAIENTLTAFRKSSQLDTPLILEMDLCMTKDGSLVVFHDNDMGRLCGPEWKGSHIKHLTLSQLPPLVVPKPLIGKLDLSDKDCTRIPLFEDVLKEFPQFPMQIDVKDGSEEMIIKVGSLIRQHNRSHLTVWGSFKHQQSNWCYKHFGTSIPLFFSVRRWIASNLLSRVGLTHWMEYRESCLIVPNWDSVLRKSWFRALNELGIQVIVWGSKQDVADGPGGGINTVEGFERIRLSGANGICSDRPTLLKDWLRQNKMTRVE
ncbi:Lysophospholipase D gdpd1 [Chytriomyces hyalinus]|nr:Lysophospholipase D gdpd1 [Chytriomyces hyalinus]KAJ3245493.1 Lysophospholipase D gdpd1 [Chytriomyces hyalinus]